MELSKHTRRDFMRLAGLSTAGVIIAACAPSTPALGRGHHGPEVEKAAATATTAAPAAEPTKAPEAEAEPTKAPEGEAAMPSSASRPCWQSGWPPASSAGGRAPARAPCDRGAGIHRHVRRHHDRGRPEHQPQGRRPRPGQWRLGLELGPHLQRAHRGPAQRPQGIFHVGRPHRVHRCHAQGHEVVRWRAAHHGGLVYWYEDIMQNEEITPLPHMDFRWGGEVMKLDVIDDYTFKLTFAPCRTGCWSTWRTITAGGTPALVPAHYMKQFHIKYNDKAGDLAKAAGFDFWYQYHGQRNDTGINAERPVLTPFVPVRDSPTMSFWERNPYYYAVDPEGNQLPYIDKLNMDKAADLSILDAKIVGGSYDFAPSRCGCCSMPPITRVPRRPAHTSLWNTGKGSEVVYNLTATGPMKSGAPSSGRPLPPCHVAGHQPGGYQQRYLLWKRL